MTVILSTPGVPYTGATGNVNLGCFNITAQKLITLDCGGYPSQIQIFPKTSGFFGNPTIKSIDNAAFNIFAYSADQSNFAGFQMYPNSSVVSFTVYTTILGQVNPLSITGTNVVFNVPINSTSIVSTPFSAIASNASFYEINIQNTSSANGSSSDVTATTDTGTSTTQYIDMGINSSGGGTAPFTTALEGYLYTSDNNLNIGAIQTGQTVKFFAGDATTARMTIASTGVTLGSALPVGSGGTGVTAVTAYALLTGNTTTTGAIHSVANSATTGNYLRSAGTAAYPIWSTLVLPNAATANRIVYATGSNAWGENAGLTFDGNTLDIISTSAPQLSTQYSSSIYTNFQVGSDGTNTLTNVGGSQGDFVIYPIGAGTSLQLLTDCGKMTIGGTAYETLLWDYTGTNVVGVSSASGVTDLTFTGIQLSAPLFHCTTAPTANSTGTVVIVAKDAAALTANSGWMPFQRSDGTTVYIPYWI